MVGKACVGSVGQVLGPAHQGSGRLVSVAEVVSQVLGDRAVAPILRLVQAHAEDLLGHCTRVSLLAVALARAAELGLDERRLATAAVLHDCGKLWIPPRVLNKPGSFTQEERGMMESHPRLGRYVLEFHQFPMSQMVDDVVTHHHEHYNGGGYPLGLDGSHIPIAAQVVSICDAYDAMVSVRPYGTVKTPAAAVQELSREAHHQFNPRLTEIFCRLVLRNPEMPWFDPLAE